MQEKNELKRTLTLFGLTMVAIGGTIGSGIFRTPWKIAEALHLPEYIIAVWILGGIVAMTGALTFSEMGGMFPGAGGLYVYLRKAYGDTVGFLYGWFILLISTSGSIAALVVVCAEHLNVLFDLGENGIRITSISIIVIVSIINIFSVKLGEYFSNLFTGAKLLGIFMIIVIGLMFAPGNTAEMVVTNAEKYATAPDSLSAAFALAFIGVLWSYGGWQHASYLAGEVKNPQQNVPRAMIIGALVITLVYVLANVAYMRLLPIPAIAQTKTVAALAVQQVIPWGDKLIAALIAASTFGTAGIYCLTAPRIYYAMANDGIFFSQIAKVHPTYRTPINAILIQSVWSIILLLFWGTFEELIEYVTFMDWVGLMLVGTSIFVFRKKMPDMPRVYKTLGYPITPLIFIVICIWFIAYTLIQKPIQAGAGIVVLIAGWLVYYFVFKNKKVTNEE